MNIKTMRCSAVAGADAVVNHCRGAVVEALHNRPVEMLVLGLCSGVQQ